ncbi:hypothetical protein CRG98_030166, partial [Punica granatum]
MPGLDPSIVKHFLPLDTKRFPPKRQHLRRQRAGLLLRIKEEIIKQINAGFLEVCNYFEWVANIVPMEKKDGRVRVCVDYRDLNKANPKDNFPLSHIDVLVDNTARHTLLSFMDGFSGYNQIRMAEEDKIKTTLRGKQLQTIWRNFQSRMTRQSTPTFRTKESSEWTRRKINPHGRYALATLASMVSITKENLIEPLEIEIAKGPAHCDAIETTDEQPWYEDIKHFLQTGQYPTFANRCDRKTLRRLATHYFLSGETLYRRSFDTTLL